MNKQRMILNIQDLANIMMRLSRHLGQFGNRRIEIPVAYYWEVGEKVKYDPYAVPGGCTLGDIEDDWQDLSRLLREEEKPIILDLRDLASVLIAFADHITEEDITSTIDKV